MKGKAIIFSAPSGTGKTTIVQHLLTQDLNLEFSISACSREARVNEIDGKDYHFLGIEGFKQKIQENAFIEWEEVYENQFYGTLKSAVEKIWQNGKHVLFDVDVIGGLNLKKYFGDDGLAIFVVPPSLEILEERLRNRKSETEESLNKRLAKAEKELSYAKKFDTEILNDSLDKAYTMAYNTIKEFLDDN